MQTDEIVIGLVEVELNLDQFYDTVLAICRRQRRQRDLEEKTHTKFWGWQRAANQGQKTLTLRSDAFVRSDTQPVLNQSPP